MPVKFLNPEKMEVKPLQGWICLECGAFYETEGETINCCDPIIKFECPVCESKYDDEDDAKECCPRQVHEVEVPNIAKCYDIYKCPICPRVYDNKQDAIDCCKC